MRIGPAAFHWNNATKRQRKGTMVSDFECDSVAGHAMSGGQRTVVVSQLPVHQLLDGVRMHSVWCDHSRSLSKQSSVRQLREADLFKCKHTAEMAKPSSILTRLLVHVSRSCIREQIRRGQAGRFMTLFRLVENRIKVENEIVQIEMQMKKKTAVVPSHSSPWTWHVKSTSYADEHLRQLTTSVCWSSQHDHEVFEQIRQYWHTV